MNKTSIFVLFPNFQKQMTTLPLPTNLVILSQETNKLLRHNLPLVNSCWLFPVNFSSLRFSEMPSKRTCSVIFQGPKRGWSFVFVASFEDVCNICLSSVVLNLSSSAWPFKEDRMCPCKDGSWFSRQPWVQPIGSNRLFWVKSSQVVPALFSPAPVRSAPWAHSLSVEERET